MRTCLDVTGAVALLIGTELWAFITPSYASPTEVRAATAHLLPYYAVPTRYITLPDFP